MNYSLEVPDHVRLNFSPSVLVFLNIALAFIMFGVALGIKPEHFEEIVKKPKSAIIGFISQTFLLPAFTFLLVLLLNPNPAIALGMILVAACPGWKHFKFYKFNGQAKCCSFGKPYSRLHLGYYLFYPFQSCPLGKFLHRLLKCHGAAGLLRPLEIDKNQMFRTAIILLGIPVIIGLFVAKKFPKLTEKIKNPITRVSLLFFILMVVAMLSANFCQFTSYVHLVFFIVILHNGLALATGYFFSKINKLHIHISPGKEV